MFIFIIKYWKYLLSGFVSGIIGYQAGYFIGHKIGYNKGYDAASVEFIIDIDEKNREITNAKNNLEKEIFTSNDDDLDRRLARWMRD